MGFVSRHENVLVAQFKGIMKLACLMAGRATILVQDDFNVYDEWKPGDRMFMEMIPQGSTDGPIRSYDIKYKHVHDIETAGSIFIFVGIFLKMSGHPYYKCCEISAVACVSEEFSLINT